jgi:hypothetical protein
MFPLLLIVAGAALYAMSSKKNGTAEPPKRQNPDIPGVAGQQIETLAASFGCKMDDAIAADPTAKSELQKLLAGAYSGEISPSQLRTAANNYRRSKLNSTAMCLDSFANYFETNTRR